MFSYGFQKPPDCRSLLHVIRSLWVIWAGWPGLLQIVPHLLFTPSGYYPFPVRTIPRSSCADAPMVRRTRARCISNTFWPETFLFQSQPVHLLSSSYSSACPQKLVQKPNSHRLSLLMHGPSVHSKVLFLFSWSQLTFIYFSVGLCPSFAASYLHCKS